MVLIASGDFSLHFFTVMTENWSIVNSNDLQNYNFYRKQFFILSFFLPRGNKTLPLRGIKRLPQKWISNIKQSKSNVILGSSFHPTSLFVANSSFTRKSTLPSGFLINLLYGNDYFTWVALTIYCLLWYKTRHRTNIKPPEW